MRKIIGKIHLWLSMLVGLFIVLIGITGSVLVFEPELNHVINPHLFNVTEGEKVTYQQALDTVSNKYPKGEIKRVYTPDEPDAKGVYLFRLKEGEKQQEIYVDPGTGEINGTLDDHALLNILLDFHKSLLLEDFKGENIVGIIGFLFFFITLSGIYLWWPGIKKWTSGFRMRRNKNVFVKNYDLHKVIGAVSLPFLLIVSLTGALFTYDEALFGWFGVKAKVTPPEEKLISKPLPTGKLPLDLLLSSAEKEVPNGMITQVRMPEKMEQGMSEGAVEIRLSRSYDPGDGNIRVWVDQYSGKIVGKLDPKINRGLLYQIWHFPLHTGTFGGIFTKILYAIGGLTPSILMITGTYMWWFKKKNKRKQRKRTVQAA
ncbi:PepSY-associated TM helix domain-containing protein [Bacillus salipaludis]|uniref:PepSY-associated TM helix domain-containing protein n=1 Tax=Bacillus salipaludis TaxID=2547811 RepID=A0AA90TSA5_9BACI|nr:PepSY-associated TM helix domain-containing protein [Bacillus salipaludis]MDQ6594959.1 PepSY-associated TM helix domain-containing protein [Bacillus salipaludis]